MRRPRTSARTWSLVGAGTNNIVHALAALPRAGRDHVAVGGLGATFSLWDDRIIVGAGYNLFAEEANDGRVYYFIGSSLIPLLQALNGN